MGDLFVYSVVFTGISVVFLALVLLVFIIFSFGKSVGLIEKIAQKGKRELPKRQPFLPPVEKRVIENTDPSPEIVAAISAAVASVMGTNRFRIQSIRQKKKSDRFAWRTFASHTNSSLKRG